MQLAFKVYRRPFRVPVRTSRGVWEAREGILLRLEDADGRVGFGEIAPLEAFGTETLAGALAWIAALAGRAERSRLEDAPRGLPCCRAAVAAALAGLDPGDDAPPRATAPVAALLPGGAGAPEALRRLADDGFATFKLKIGAAAFPEERTLVERVCEALPSSGKLRLDANGGLAVRDASRWLELAQAWPVEFLEQPLPAGADRDLLALARDHAATVALDESVRSADDVKRWRDLGWEGLFVIKPAFVGDAAALRAEVAVAPDRFVFSSALETDVGLRAAIGLAFDCGVTRALGFGVGAFFPDDGLGGFLREPVCDANAVRALDVGATWLRL